MTSINRLSTNGVAGYLDISPAFANLNFDFSIYKIDAPKEFQGVGEALARLRREEAESGTPHRTARRLGALFDRILPPTPELFRAYGSRASEISNSSQVRPQDPTSFGSFAARAGADATSLWAAATSGPSAISVHLLACMLANIWEGPEATSIWVEIVSRRKHEIIVDFEQNSTTDIASLAAAQQDLTREQLAEWDASARAWLQTADGVKKRQQVQVRLIIDNVAGTVSTIGNVYESVISAWKTSLSQMENLLKGIPQQAQSGAALLSLASWHLYPDMVAIGTSTTEVSQADSLFPTGGILTIGLQPSDTKKGNGISWSLPLAHLRYYGPPVVKSRSIESAERSRITLDELLLASLGCFIQGWEDEHSRIDNRVDTQSAIKVISGISKHLTNAAAAGSRKALSILKGTPDNSWLNWLFETADRYLHSTGDEHKVAKRLVELGRTHGKHFLEKPLTPCFGLLTLKTLIRLHRGEEDKIQILRSLAITLPFQRDQILIRYKHVYPDRSKTVDEFTTALPRGPEDYNGDVDRTLQPDNGHCRWIVRDAVHDNPSERQAFYASRGEMVYGQGPSVSVPAFDRDVQMQYRLAYGIYKGPYSSAYRVFAGDEESASLLVREMEMRPPLKDFRSSKAELEDVCQIMDSDNVDAETLIDHLHRYLSQRELGRSSAHVKSLSALAATANVYKNFPGATVDVRVLRQHLDKALWVPQRRTVPAISHIAGYDASKPYPKPLLSNQQASELQALLPALLSRAETFACICMFDSGQFNLPPSTLENVMAMASGDSIYVSAFLLSDPAEHTDHGGLKRVISNIGRPGIAFLTSPENPMIRPADLDTWKLVNRDEFDGQRQDCFASTSLHLSFTGPLFQWMWG
jgi:hypothetical protein